MNLLAASYREHLERGIVKELMVFGPVTFEEYSVTENHETCDNEYTFKNVRLRFEKIGDLKGREARLFFEAIMYGRRKSRGVPDYKSDREKLIVKAGAKFGGELQWHFDRWETPLSKLEASGNTEGKG